MLSVKFEKKTCDVFHTHEMSEAPLEVFLLLPFLFHSLFILLDILFYSYFKIIVKLSGIAIAIALYK